MALSFPTIDLPWKRKTALQRTQAELRKIQKDVEAKADKIEFPKVDLPKIRSEDVGAAVEETRRAAAHGMEQVAVTAAQLGREAGKLGRKAGRRGRELSHELAATGEESVRQLGTDVRSLTDDVRSLRITREKRRPDIIPGVALLAGLGSGLAAMYYFDPEQGRRRRALLRDQLVKWSRLTTQTVEGQMKDLRNRSMGLAHELRRSVSGALEDDDIHPDTAEQADVAVAEATPDASSDLAATDKVAGSRPAGRRRSASKAAAGQAAGSKRAGQPAAAGGGRQEQIYSAYGDVAAETWGDLTVPEGQEGQPDLTRKP